MMYDPHHWFWIVAGDETQLYSSAAQAYVTPGDPAYAIFLAEGKLATRIVSEAELRDVLAAYGRRLLTGEQAAADSLKAKLEADEGAAKADAAIRALAAMAPAEAKAWVQANVGDLRQAKDLLGTMAAVLCVTALRAFNIVKESGGA